MKEFLRKIRYYLIQSLSFFRNRYSISLIVLSIILSLWAGFIFWRYAYLVVNSKEEVFIQPVKIEENSLKSILDDFEKRDKNLKEIE